MTCLIRAREISAPDGEVQVRGEPPLWLDGGEVLHVIAGTRRRFCTNRSTSLEKCSASRAALA